ncbi:hypothetical protein AB0I60_05200 [Actinosynnema sp. NPDC050436]|uniref:hypothetical protein n=1 Tax=Actinosynnema sp. NPDC050436 TaxID=3155659 RepID=UPI0034068DEC
MTTTPTVPAEPPSAREDKPRRILARVLAHTAGLPAEWGVATPLAPTRHLVLVDGEGRPVAGIARERGPAWDYVVFPVRPDGLAPLSIPSEAGDWMTVPYRTPPAEAARTIAAKLPRYRALQATVLALARERDHRRAEAVAAVTAAARRLGEPDPLVRAHSDSAQWEPLAYWQGTTTAVRALRDGRISIEITAAATADDLDTALAELASAIGAIAPTLHTALPTAAGQHPADPNDTRHDTEGEGR